MIKVVIVFTFLFALSLQKSQSLYRLSQEIKCHFSFEGSEQETSCKNVAFDPKFENLYISSSKQTHLFQNDSQGQAFEYLKDQSCSPSNKKNQIVFATYNREGNILAEGYYDNGFKIETKTYQNKQQKQDIKCQTSKLRFNDTDAQNTSYAAFVIGQSLLTVAKRQNNSLSFYFQTQTDKNDGGNFVFTGNFRKMGFSPSGQLFYLQTNQQFRLFSHNNQSYSNVTMNFQKNLTNSAKKVQFMNSSFIIIMSNEQLSQKCQNPNNTSFQCNEMKEKGIGLFSPDLNFFIKNDKNDIKVYNASSQQLTQTLPLCLKCKFVDMWFNQNETFVVKQDTWVSIYRWKTIESDGSWIISVIVLSVFTILGVVSYVIYLKKIKNKQIEKEKGLLFEETDHASDEAFSGRDKKKKPSIPSYLNYD